jgi:hypothetical protein
LEGLATEDVGIFYGRLVYFAAIWFILWPFGIFCGHSVYFIVIWYTFPYFGMLQEIIGNPAKLAHRAGIRQRLLCRLL